MQRRKRELTLDEAFNRLFKKHVPQCDETNELQSEIHKDLNFKRNSVNLFVGGKGSGKTFNVLREISKMTILPNHGYTQFIYVSDKTSDETYKRFEPMIDLPKRRVRYEDIEEVLTNLLDAKDAYKQVVDKGCSEKLTDSCREDLLSTLGVTDFETKHHHTLVFYDDALNVFKNTKSKIFTLLFENRHGNITYFLNIQDPQRIDASVKSNIDSLWLFGGFSPQ